MTNTLSRRFPISFDAGYRALSSLLLLSPSRSYVEVDGQEVLVRMGWAFSSRFSRRAVVSVTESASTPMSRGVHGFGGRWLVNGSGRGILSVKLNPSQRAYVTGFPIRLRELLVSVEEPRIVAEALLGEPSRRRPP